MRSVFMDPRELTGDELSKRRRYTVLGFVGVLACMVIIYSIIAIIKSIPPTRIVLNYTPSSAVATINGVEISERVLDYPPGDYTIEIKKYGFETFTTTIALGQFETKNLFVTLQPVMPFTENWFDKNPEDGAIADGEASYNYDAAAGQMLKDYPVIKKLPIKREDFNIYYGICKDDRCEIVIEAEQKYYDTAVHYFYNNLDSDIGKYYFVFINYGNQFQGERNGFGV